MKFLRIATLLSAIAGLVTGVWLLVVILDQPIYYEWQDPWEERLKRAAALAAFFVPTIATFIHTLFAWKKKGPLQLSQPGLPLDLEHEVSRAKIRNVRARNVARVLGAIGALTGAVVCGGGFWALIVRNLMRHRSIDLDEFGIGALCFLGIIAGASNAVYSIKTWNW